MLQLLLYKTTGFSLLTLEVIFVAFLAISFACERSKLPANLKLNQRGRVLRIHCAPDHRPWIAFTDGRIEPARSRSAYYICLYGDQFRQISAAGIENSSFFCADTDGTKCPVISSKITPGIIRISSSLAKWESSDRSISILYCSLGVWHQLGESPLSGEIQTKKITTREVTTETSVPVLENETTSQSGRNINKSAISTRESLVELTSCYRNSIKDVEHSMKKRTPIVPPNEVSIEKRGEIERLLEEKWAPLQEEIKSTTQLPEANEFSVLKDDIVNSLHFGLLKYTMITFGILTVMITLGITYGLVQWRRLRKRRECRKHAAEHAKNVLSNVVKIF